jgi:hypothetical protein
MTEPAKLHLKPARLMPMQSTNLNQALIRVDPF